MLKGHVALKFGLTTFSGCKELTFSPASNTEGNERIFSFMFVIHTVTPLLLHKIMTFI